MLKSEGLKSFAAEPKLQVEYLEIVQQNTLDPVDEARNAGVLFAGVLDGVRLIDNLLLQ